MDKIKRYRRVDLSTGTPEDMCKSSDVSALEEKLEEAVDAMEYYLKYKGDVEMNPDIQIRSFLTSIKEQK